MGLFDFLKPKDKGNNKNAFVKPSIEPDIKGGFDLKLSDFYTQTQSAQVISVKVSPDFYELFPEAKAPAETGDKLELKTAAINIVFWGQTVEVSFNPNDIPDNSEAFITQINKQLNWLIKNPEAVNEVIIRDLLQLKNDNWLNEDETPLTKESFLKSIRLTSIGFYEDTNFSLYYDDGDLFFGHTIIVEINAEREVQEASIAG
ncbi:DUF2262 domain-containing protein [Mucilaginibacter mali]|uniref:DUF2262 domain-containing protein n=1 Tax=Mucilaginibacter mali TaxID=2740462 RepID=A0A7D4Q2V5_9SPHI|nr:DUF2262 domain-containing protein [Mucilaginibacter mali]QKJ29867.1 DUF2262 domain-containing protein [Mucilaginibacter mali]